MTGFGAGQANIGDARISVEVRALNHRHTEVRVRLPNELLDQGAYVEQLARERLGRGRFDIGVRVLGSALPGARFSRERARRLYGELLELRDQIAPGAEVPFTAITAMPELITAPDTLDSEELRRALGTAFDVAATALAAMRESEGRALLADIQRRHHRCRELVAALHARAGRLVESYREKLRERLERLLAEARVQLDAGRLEQEVALLADRADIAEELARLDSHLDYFATTLGESGPLGRKLEFVLQEIGREANTIAAKAQDASAAHLVVELKAEIERLREQVQNVE
ncbi:MAG: YicC/YloC family endoribonuclease [Pseudomonadota bacterium]